MKTFLTTLRYDLQRLRWAILPWLGIQMWWIFVSLPSLELEPSRIEAKYSAYVIMVHIGWLGILTFLSFTHPPTESRAAWRTRPAHGWIVGLEKICLGLLLLAIIPAASSLASAPFRDSQSSTTFFPTWASILSAYTGAFLGSFFFASLTKNVREFFGFGIALLVVGMAFGGARFLFGSDIGIGVTATCLIILLGTVGFVTLIIAQYHRSRRQNHAVLAGLLVVVLFGVLPKIFPNYLGRPPQINPKGASLVINSIEQFDRSNMTAQLVRAFRTQKFPGEKDPQPWLRLNVSPSNFDPSYIWELNSIAMRVSMSPVSIIALGGGHLLLNDELLVQLGIPDYQLSSAIADSVFFERPDFPEKTAKISMAGKQQPRFSFRVSRLELKELADTPLQPQLQHTFPSELSLEVSDLGVRYGHPLLAVDTKMPAIQHRDFVLDLVPNPPRGIGRNWVSRHPLLLLIDDENKRAHILKTPRYTTVEIFEHSREPEFRTGKRLPDWDTPLDQLRLKVFEITSTGHFLLRAKIPPEHE